MTLITVAAAARDPSACPDAMMAPVDEERLPLFAAAGGAALAAAGFFLAAGTGEPYLDSDAVNPWIVVFAAGLLALLFAVPFALERRMRAALADADRRWERALLAWGAVAVGVLLAGVLLGVSAGWASGESLAGAVGLLLTIESGLILGTLAAWVLSS